MENQTFDDLLHIDDKPVLEEPVEEKQVEPISVTEALVEQAHMAAAEVIIKKSDPIKKEILEAAESTVHNKTEELKNKAEIKAKKALFENNKDACACFGFEEDTTEKWAVNYMKIWNRIFTLLYLIVGSFTFAPVLYIAGKLRAIIKRSWVAVLLAVSIYLIVVLSPIWMGLISIVKGV